MSTSATARELLSQALHLPAEERQTLAIQFMASIPEEEVGSPRIADALLAQAIERRIAERDAGQAKTIDVATFATRVRSAAKTNGDS